MLCVLEPPKRSFAERLDDRSLDHAKRFLFEATGEKIRPIEIDLNICYFMLWRSVIHRFAEKHLPLDECSYEEALSAIRDLALVVKEVRFLVKKREERMFGVQSKIADDRRKSTRLQKGSSRVRQSR
jgi:hypothetical protein